MINIRAILALSLGISALLGIAMLFFLVFHGSDETQSVSSAAAAYRDAQSDRFYVEQHLLRLRKEPLSWTCIPGTPDRLRLTSSGCWSEHILEVDFSDDRSSATARLSAYEHALFRNAQGEPVRGSITLEAPASKAMYAAVANGFRRLPSYLPDSQSPAVQTVIEACIGGRSHMVVRNFSGDREVEDRAARIIAASGISFSQDEKALICL